MRRLGPALVAGLVGAGAVPAVADAHGLVQRQQLPIPQWLFAWSAAAVLVIGTLTAARVAGTVGLLFDVLLVAGFYRLGIEGAHSVGGGIDYTVFPQADTWYVHVAVVVLGHVAGLVLAHDRALALYNDGRLAARSQYWMLGVMVGFTSLALWLLAQAG